MPMASKIRIAFAALLAILAGGCVYVENGSGLTPPPALFSHIRATVGDPCKNSPCKMDAKKIGHTDSSVHVKEWVFTGISADIIDMEIARAAAQDGLKNIYYVDYDMTSYFGFVTTFELTAYGE